MKHTFWYIDELMYLIGPKNMPKKLTTEKDIEKAKEIVEKVKEYDQKLRKLIDSHKTGEHLEKLKAFHADSIPDWAERVDAQFRKLDSYLSYIEQDIPKLEWAIKAEVALHEKLRFGAIEDVKDPNTHLFPWEDKVGNMAIGFLQAGFHEAEHNMEEFRKIAIFKEHHLKEILGELSDIEHLLE